MRLGEVGPERNGIVKARQRFREARQSNQRRSQVDVSSSNIWIERYCLGDQLNAFPCSTGLKSDNPQEMQCFEEGWVLPQEVLIDRLCLGKSPVLMQGNCLPEGFLYRC